MQTHETIDCQEMTLRIQEKIAEETQGMSIEERIKRQQKILNTGNFSQRWNRPVPEFPQTSEEKMPHKTKGIKDFDCVEMKHRIQEEIENETKGMTPEQRMEWSRRKLESGPFAERWKRKPGGQD